jgi:hypothetical protein
MNTDRRKGGVPTSFTVFKHGWILLRAAVKTVRRALWLSQLVAFVSWVAAITGLPWVVHAQPAGVLPLIATKAELVADNLSSSVIHGWQSSRLVKYNGVVWACGTIDNPKSPDEFKTSGVFFRRHSDGGWKAAGTLPHAVYSMCVGPEGEVWAIAPHGYSSAEIYLTRRPLDFSSFEEVFKGTCAYEGASVSPEGNFLLLYAESAQMRAFVTNAVWAAFYEKTTGTWHKSRMITPEGRYGYEGMIVRGKRAIAVLNSAIQDPKANPVAPHYSWRHVRLARCEDLTKGEWAQEPFVMPAFGGTALQDLMLGPGGKAYLVYNNQSSDTLEGLSKVPYVEYIVRIHPDLRTDRYTPGIEVGPAKLFCDGKGRWFMAGKAGKEYHLWRLDPDKGFKPVKEWRLEGTEVLEGYVCHTLRPERFGGEADTDTIHLMTAKYFKAPDRAQLWHVFFTLPE